MITDNEAKVASRVGSSGRLFVIFLAKFWFDYNNYKFEAADILSFVESSESGADGGNIWPRAFVLSPAVLHKTDEELVVSTCPAGGQSSGQCATRCWWSCELTGGSGGRNGGVSSFATRPIKSAANNEGSLPNSCYSTVALVLPICIIVSGVV